jgi:hypothetical protein
VPKTGDKPPQGHEESTVQKATTDPAGRVGTAISRNAELLARCRIIVSKAYRNVDSHVRHRVRQWLCAKFKVPGHGRRRFSDQYLHQTLGLYQLQRTKEQLFVGERVKQNMKYSLVRKPGAGKPHAGFDERDVETESW